MEKNPIEQIDMVLKLLQIDRGHITFDHIMARLISDNGEQELSGDVLRRIIEKLVRDGYVYIAIPKGTDYEKYAITFEGFTFHGYANQIIVDGQIETRIRRNELFLIRGTWFAGVAAALVFLWYIFLYFYPVHKDYPYWIWETIPKRNP